MKKILCILMVTFIVSSCTMEKRVYLPGYYVEWSNGKDVAKSQQAIRVIEQAEINQLEPIPNNDNIINTDNDGYVPLNQTSISENELIASNDNSVIPVSVLKSKTGFNQPLNAVSHIEKEKKEKLQVLKEFKSEKKNDAQNANKSSGGGKNQLVALLLCIFVGGIGIHRFYLGYIGIGIIQLLTFGGCGIWTLIDLVRIINGDLGPKNGNYENTL